MFESLQLHFYFWKFRIRMSRALAADAPAAPATANELSALVKLQTTYWQRHRPPTGAALRQALQTWNGQRVTAYVVSVRGHRVSLWDKPPSIGRSEQQQHEDRGYHKRAQLYQLFFEKALRQAHANLTLDFALDVADQAQDDADLPIFSFQKPPGACNPLIPDVDFFHSKWYRDEHNGAERDALDYDAKTVSACFVGASTGADLTVDSIRQAQTPRLRAATYFVGHARVTFRIAKAVQCLSDEARQVLMAQPYFCDFVPWQAQLRHRFILSMDGNGAACSRLVKGLRSHSVVIKYDSPHELYYFAALKPGRDYLLASSDQQVARFIDQELARPGLFKQVSVNGQKFADKYLTVRSVMDYTVQLLAEFAALCQGQGQGDTPRVYPAPTR